MKSGLYEELTGDGLLISHRELKKSRFSDSDGCYRFIEPELITFISYPYEWCFSQLQDAALATLAVQKKALEYGMSLKDASFFNIQFRKAKPVFIDTLSFEKLQEDKPWIAYGQFCRHFLIPLLLASYGNPKILSMLKDNLDGVPPDMAATLLPPSVVFNKTYLLHVALQFVGKWASRKGLINERTITISTKQVIHVVDDLIEAVQRLKLKHTVSTWNNYYNLTHYTKVAFEEKQRTVSHWVRSVNPSIIWDIGANDGRFSTSIDLKSALFICMDSDPLAVENCYLTSKANSTTNILPLVVDIANPTPGIGWNNNERLSLLQRSPADVVMMLALIHHLIIGQNIPLIFIIKFLHSICKYVIIEFIPKEDPKVQELLQLRHDIYSDYTKEYFEFITTKSFEILKETSLTGSKRILYFLKAK